MWWVYILQSATTNRFYIGHTARLDTRIDEHNSGHTRSTRGRGPWRLVYHESFATQSEAAARERQLKSWKSHRSLQDLIDQQAEHPGMPGES